MGYGILNLGSIVLGLVGWGLPVVHLMSLSKGKKGPGRWVHILSMGACCLAIWLQICYGEHLVNIGDWSALMDTVGAVRMVSLFLLVTTFVVNVVVLVLGKGKENEK